MRLICFRVVVLSLLLSSFAAQATPFTITPASGLPGDEVTVSLVDSQTNDLEAATLNVKYDFSRLALLQALPGDESTGDVSILAAEPSRGLVLLSWATNSHPINLQDYPILTLQFNILSNAPAGFAPIAIECPSDETCTQDYNVPRTLGGITVLPTTTGLPEADTLSLLLLGLAAFLQAHRRKRQTCEYYFD